MSRLEFPLEQGWTKGIRFAFEDIKSSARIDLDDFFHVKQVHGSRIYEPTSACLHLEDFVEADGILLRDNAIKSFEKPVLMKTADCVPLVYIDRESQSVAILHAGWRGLIQGIHRSLFDDSVLNPKTTWVWIGPSLNGRDFELGEDVWADFSNYTDDTEVLEPHEQDEEKRYFHAWKFLEKEMKKLEVEMVYNVEVSTFREKAFASWRRFSKAGLKKVPQQNYSWICWE